MKHRIIFAVLMSCVLTFIMSAWVTFINIGLVDKFVERWFSAWSLAWPAAGIIAFLFAPRVHQLSSVIANKL